MQKYFSKHEQSMSSSIFETTILLHVIHAMFRGDEIESNLVLSVIRTKEINYFILLFL